MPPNPPAVVAPGGICDMSFDDILAPPGGRLADTGCLKRLEATA
ncbi:MAG: hypothetical protein ACLGHG_05390 [Gammaproteobacteria bacterium]